MKIVYRPSPHFRTGRRAKLDTVVLHYISAINILPSDPYNVEECLKLLTEPIRWYDSKKKKWKDNKVSAHIVIDRNGVVYKLVNYENTSWHAGRSSWKGREVNNSVNDISIGIEMIGGKWEPFTEAQYKSLGKLLKTDILPTFGIDRESIVGHCDVAPGRKIDPGKHFNWEKLYDIVYGKNVNLVLPDVVRIKKKEEYKNGLKNINPVPTNNITDGRDKESAGVYFRACSFFKRYFNRRRRWKQ